MLRRLSHATGVVKARAGLMAMHTTRSLLNTNNKGHSSEDQAELERERALRERFAQKIGGFTGAFNNASNSSSSTASGSSSGSSSSSNPNAGPQPSNFLRIFFFISAIYMLMLIAQIEDPNSMISMFQGMKWWQVPTETVAYLALMRTLLPFREQTRLKGEFEEAQKRDPNLTFPLFFQTRYPDIFRGNRASQQQLVAAVAACLAASRDIAIITHMQQAAGMARVPRDAADRIMDALYKDYPHVFAPVPSQ